MPTLDFKGKQFIYSYHHSVPFRELNIDKDKSLAKDNKPSLDDNLIINGDNLHALKALLPLYAGKIKCIYIDPPYNTGNEGWCYNDNVNSPLMKEWLKKNANPVDKEDLERHDKWLCMMYPRLKLLHELLSDDGVIFISIDDNEVHNLRSIMDEIFGEENFITQFIWQKKTGASDARTIATVTEYVICYVKNDDDLKNRFSRNLESYDVLRYRNKDKYIEKRGNYYIDNLDRGGLQYSDSMNYPITCPDGSITYPNGREKFQNDGWIWKWGRDKVKWAIEKDFIEFRKSESKKSGWAVCYKNYLYVDNKNQKIERSAPIKNIINNVLNANSATEIKNIFNKQSTFNYPKPKELIKKIICSANLQKNSIILDSFAGSGTTAHAVLDLNKEDGGNRKFILVEMEDYANDITAERVRRVINGVPNAKDEKLRNGLGGSFTFCKLGDEFNIEKILTGESLPKYEALANYVFYTATGKSLEKETKERMDFYIGETDLYEIYLIYKADIAFLRSNESALNSKKLEQIIDRGGKKQKLVFASSKFMGQNELKQYNISFCQLPYAIHKVAGQ